MMEWTMTKLYGRHGAIAPRLAKIFSERTLTLRLALIWLHCYNLADFEASIHTNDGRFRTKSTIVSSSWHTATCYSTTDWFVCSCVRRNAVQSHVCIGPILPCSVFELLSSLCLSYSSRATFLLPFSVISPSIKRVPTVSLNALLHYPFNTVLATGITPHSIVFDNHFVHLYQQIWWRQEQINKVFCILQFSCFDGTIA